MILHATANSDIAIMDRTRIGSDSSYDIYVQSSNLTQEGRLGDCPNITDPNAQSTILDNNYAPTSPYITSGTGVTNTITVIAVENIINFYVNGYKLQTACNSTSLSGLFGLFAASPNKNEVTEAVFSNLKIWTHF